MNLLKFTSNKRILNDVTMLKVTQYIYRVQLLAHYQKAHGLQVGQLIPGEPNPWCSADGLRTVQFSVSDTTRGPFQGTLVVPWGISPPNDIRCLLQVPKVEVHISKVGPPFVRNNPRGPHPHEKCQNQSLLIH